MDVLYLAANKSSCFCNLLQDFFVCLGFHVPLGNIIWSIYLNNFVYKAKFMICIWASTLIDCLYMYSNNSHILTNYGETQLNYNRVNTKNTNISRVKITWEYPTIINSDRRLTTPSYLQLSIKLTYIVSVWLTRGSVLMSIQVNFWGVNKNWSWAPKLIVLKKNFTSTNTQYNPYTY